MIFLIDENLSPRLVSLHTDSHRAIHINQLKPTQKTQIKDDLIRKLSLDHPFVLVTKDDDFVKSWVDRKVPEKIIFIYDNFPNLSEMLDAYEKQIPLLESMVTKHDFIEFSNKGIRTPFDEELPFND